MIIRTFTCRVCKHPFTGRRVFGRGGPQAYCGQCARNVAALVKIASGAKRAHKMIRDAIKHGHLPRLDGDYACVDCGESATCYDHRDYNYPLMVEPVCRSCNGKRGRAKHILGDIATTEQVVYTFWRAWNGPQPQEVTA